MSKKGHLTLQKKHLIFGGGCVRTPPPPPPPPPPRIAKKKRILTSEMPGAMFFKEQARIFVQLIISKTSPRISVS